MDASLKQKLVRLSATLLLGGAITTGGIAVKVETDKPSPAIQLAMELGAHFESGGRHIGTPYRDEIGKGRPWTVCHGVTGPEVIPSKYYTEEECRKLELPKYRQAEQTAKRMLKYWSTYNVWVQASFIDMIYNLGAGALETSTAIKLANQGNLDGACAQMPRWVYGTVQGLRVRLAGLVTRREASRELCAEWGRTGSFQ